MAEEHEYDPLAEDDALEIPQPETPELDETPEGDPSPEAENPPAEPLTKDDSETWQAAFTKARQADRKRYGALEEEHGTYKNVLQNFYSDDQYAMQVFRQRFPHLAGQLQGGTSPQRTQPSTNGHEFESIVQRELGNDLAFLAPALAKAMQVAVKNAIAPYEATMQHQQRASLQTQQQTLQAEMDAKYPGWDEQYGQDIQSLNQFLASDQLVHPKYGSRFELLYKLANRDQSRIDALRTAQQAARSRQSVSRSGPPTQPNIRDRVMKPARDHEAFMLAARAAAEELGL